MFRYAMNAVMLAMVALSACAVAPEGEETASSQSALTKTQPRKVTVVARDGRRVVLDDPKEAELVRIVGRREGSCCSSDGVCQQQDIVACILDLVRNCPYAPIPDDDGNGYNCPY